MTLSRTDEDVLKVQKILNLIETERHNAVIPNEVARICEFALTVLSEPDRWEEAVFANRLLVQGADPFALEYLVRGEVSEPIKQAHLKGPGLLEGRDRERWLVLAHWSADEAKEGGRQFPLRQRVLKFFRYMNRETWFDPQDACEKEEEIKELPFIEADVRGCQMRLYESDLGFASAYWSGERYAAVRGEDNIVFVGTKPETSLEEIGVMVDKQLSPQFGLIFNNSGITPLSGTKSEEASLFDQLD